MSVSPTSVVGPIKWVGHKLVDLSPTPISDKTDGVAFIKAGSDKKVIDMLRLNVTEEWIGAKIQCGVEYKDPEITSDSVTRWSAPHRLNGMRIY